MNSNNFSIFIGPRCSTPDVPFMGSIMEGKLDNNMDISEIVKKYTFKMKLMTFQI